MSDKPRTVNLGGKERPPAGERAPGAQTSPGGKGAKKGATASPSKRTPADRKLAASIAGTYTMLGGVIIGIGLRVEDEGMVGSGAQTLEMAEPLAEAWLDLGDQNPKVKAALKRFTEVSTAGTLAAMHVALLVPILAHRGIIPEAMAVAMTANAEPSPNGNGVSSN